MFRRLPLKLTQPHPHVLVIDELGYQSYAADAANVLFRVVSQRHLNRRATIVTTNKPLAAPGHVLHYADLAEAVLDQLLERGTDLVLRGRSYPSEYALLLRVLPQFDTALKTRVGIAP